MSTLLQRPHHLAALILAVATSASTWFYVNDILRSQQVADAALHNRPRGNLCDLYPRWLGTRELLLRGRDPYGPDITREIQTGYYGRPIDPTLPNDPKDQQAFAYPVYVVFVLAPTVGLPFAVVQRGFHWLLIACTAGSVLLWLSALRWRIFASAKLTWIVFALGSFPVIQGLKLQQLTLLVAALVAAAMYAITRRNFVWAGILLALASLKPQLIFLLVLWLCIWVLGNWRERQRLFWSLTVSMAVLIAGGEMVLPGWIGKFRAAAAAYYQYTGGGKSALDVLLTPLWGRTIAVVLVGISLLLLWQARHAAEGTDTFQWSFSLVLAATLVIIPMFAPYNQVLLLPSLMMAVRGIRLLWQKSHLLKFLVTIATASVFWPWLAGGVLVTALLFLPSATVQQAWALPLYTILTFPVVLLALLLVGKDALRVDGSAPQ